MGSQHLSPTANLSCFSFHEQTVTGATTSSSDQHTDSSQPPSFAVADVISSIELRYSVDDSTALNPGSVCLSKPVTCCLKRLVGNRAWGEDHNRKLIVSWLSFKALVCLLEDSQQAQMAVGPRIEFGYRNLVVQSFSYFAHPFSICSSRPGQQSRYLVEQSVSKEWWTLLISPTSTLPSGSGSE
jgi:hypothetical protein